MSVYCFPRVTTTTTSVILLWVIWFWYCEIRFAHPLRCVVLERLARLRIMNYVLYHYYIHDVHDGRIYTSLDEWWRGVEWASMEGYPENIFLTRLNFINSYLFVSNRVKFNFCRYIEILQKIFCIWICN